MKKVRLFAVAAAMGMFASTVAAAEPVVTTGYTATWGEVDEIIKVDVGDKVVAPSTTIKVVKETRTTDDEYAGSKDSLGFDVDAVCYTSTGVAEDEDGDLWSDSQIYYIYNGRTVEPVIYSSKEAAIEDYLVDSHLVLAPGAEEIERGTFYSPLLDQYFEDLEAVYNFLEEKGLVESVYDEDGDLDKIYINAKEVTDKKGNVLANVRLEQALLTGVRKPELTTKEEVAKYLIGETSLATPTAKVLYNYVAKKTPLEFWVADSATTTKQLHKGSILIVEEHKGEYIYVAHYTDPSEAVQTAPNTYSLAGMTDKNGNPVDAKGTAGKVTVYETNKNNELTKLATYAPTEVGRYTPESEMVWDVEAGTFVKETKAFHTNWIVADVDPVTNEDANADYKGYWDTKAYEYDEELEAEATTSHAEYADGNTVNVGVVAFGIEELVNDVVENPTDKYVLLDRTAISGVNSKTNKITLTYTNGKEVTVDAVEVDDILYPAFDDMETLVKVASKLSVYSNIGTTWGDDNLVDGLTEVANEFTGVYNQVNYGTLFYDNAKALDANPWSGYTLEANAKTELRGFGSEACSYVVEEKSEEVEATITSNADSVDTSVAGVKTLTLTAKVGEEVVSTKEVKVVVAPKYERTYVNGKVSVLKAFHLNGNLYAEYHYDWAAKTYSATFYQQDGVTVGSTANGTL